MGSASPFDMHVLEQDAIEVCMARDGFDYQRADFIDRGYEDGFLEMRIPGASTVGYSGVFNALSGFSANFGGPPDNLDRQTESQYVIALTGEHLDGHDGSDVQHTHGLGGCQAEGSDAVAHLRPVNLSDPTESEGVVDLVERLVATKAYVDFEAGWVECLNLAGYEVRDLNPFFHAAEMQEEYRQASFEHISELFPTTSDAIELYGEVLDVETFAVALEVDEKLNELFVEEREMSLIDRQCRSKEWSIIEGEIDTLTLDIFGIALSDTIPEEE